MNEFTKEELESIINLIEVYCDGDSMTELLYKPFYDKIQSMIDNYDKQSTKCPKCSNVRVADGMCWNMWCDYRG